jgi:hypothetical protein
MTKPITKTEAETNQNARDHAESYLDGFIDDDYTDADFEEVLEIAVDMAIDEFDAEQNLDGTWNDCTNYAECARRASEQWLAEKEDEHLGRGDYLRDLAGDR